MNDVSRKIVCQYRDVTGQYVVEKEYDFFDDIPDEYYDGDHRMERVPNQSKKGWVLVDFESMDGKHTLSEYWRVNDAPERFTRNGIEYTRQFGVPSPVQKTRLGSSLKDHCSKSFQEVLNAADRRAPKSRFDSDAFE